MREATSEPHADRLGLQLNTKLIKDTLLDRVLQADDLGRGCATAIHNGQSMFPRDAGASAGVPLRKTRMFHQPCCRELALPIASRIAWQCPPACCAPLRELID